jgi:hypothetical protein
VAAGAGGAAGADGGVAATDASDAPGTPKDAADAPTTDGPAEATPPGPDGPDAAALRANGASCLSGGECDSTLCVDGVCCGSACGGTCESCNQIGKQGTCSPVPAGMPAPECADQGAASCGFDGACNGGGGCRRYGPGVACKAASCQTSTYHPPSACDGLGTCVAASAVDCGPYLCDSSGGGATCRSTCVAGVVGCASPAVCANGSCGARVLKADGAGCVAATECASNHCVDGVCCASTCAGACMSCNQVGFEGTCRNVDAGRPDPRGVCTDAGATSCKQTGLCNGAGGCALYPSTTICAPGMCSGRVVTGARHCDGAGACPAGTDVDCSPFRCDATKAACFTSCQSNAQCANGVPKRTCQNNVCQ